MNIPQMTWALWSPGYTSSVRTFSGTATTTYPPVRRHIPLRELGAYMSVRMRRIRGWRPSKDMLNAK